MRYYRCKCGKSTAFGSMPPYPCDGCKECGTTLNEAPSQHRAPEPHKFIATPVKVDGGEGTLTRCAWCLRTKDQIKREGDA